MRNVDMYSTCCPLAWRLVSGGVAPAPPDKEKATHLRWPFPCLPEHQCLPGLAVSCEGGQGRLNACFGCVPPLRSLFSVSAKVAFARYPVLARVSEFEFDRQLAR